MSFSSGQNSKTFSMNAFHAYDIRGVYNRDFDKNDVYKIGFFLPRLLNADRVLVGRDMRESSPEVFEYLTNGIRDAGADVYNIGLSTTPMVYYATAKFGFEASVMITASHNSKEYNGLKISRANALPVGYDTGLNELERMINTFTPDPVQEIGDLYEYGVKPTYLEFLNGYKKNLSKLNLAIDCSNGMAALLVKDIFGEDANYLFDTLDGSFPNHEPNPLVESNSDELKRVVKAKQSDIGIIFDGDADRAVFIDEKGNFIPPDLMIALMGRYFLKREPGATVIQDIRSSKAVGEYIEKLGGKMHTWRVGRAYAALKLREIDGLFGGELAGHYYFKDFYYSDSALLASLIILDIVAEEKEKGRTLSQLIDEIRTYENSGEINFKINQKKEAMEAVKEHFFSIEEPEQFMDFDGYRIEYKDWWLNIRPSNTEPYLRLLVEATTKELLSDKINEIKEIINQFE